MKQQRYEANFAGAAGGRAGGRGAVFDSVAGFQRGHSWGADITENLDKAGQAIVGALSREYRASKEAEARDIGLQASREFDEWRAAYERDRQGKDALNAAADYEKKWEEIAKGARERLKAGSNTIFPGILERELKERSLFAVRDGIQYAARQNEIFRKSVYESQRKELEDYAANNPDDTDGINFKRNKVLQAMGDVYQGTDIGGLVRDLDGKTLETRMAAYEAAGDWDAMARMINARQELVDRGINEQSPLGSWAAAYNNPGNVTTDGKNMAMYENITQGVAAVMERVQNYYHRKGRRSISEIMHVYAPEEENRTEEYIRFVSKALGVGPHDRVNPDDPAFLKAMTSAIVDYENSIKLAPEQLEEGYKYLREHGKPKFKGVIPKYRKDRVPLLAPGVAPEKWRRWRNTVEAGLKNRENEALEGMAIALSEEAMNLPRTERMAFVNEQTENLPPEQRERLREAIYAGVGQRDRREDYTRRALDAEAQAETEKTKAEQAARLSENIEALAELPANERRGFILGVQGADRAESDNLQKALFAWNEEQERREGAAWRDSWQGQLDRALEECEGLSEARKKARLAAFIEAAAKNSGDADEMLAYGKRFIERQNKAREAREDALIEELAARKLAPGEIRQALSVLEKEGRIGAQGLERAKKQLIGPASAESPENARALADGKFIISSGGLQSEEARAEYAEGHNLTMGQRKELLAFQGYAANGVYSKIASALKRNGLPEASPREMDILISLLPREREATDRDIDEIVRATATREDAWIGGDSLLEQLGREEGVSGKWLPEVEDYELPALRLQLRQMGLPASGHNLQTLKKEILAHRFGFKANGQFIK